jgi:hypothetical protein
MHKKWGNNEEMLAMKLLEIVQSSGLWPHENNIQRRDKLFVTFVDDYLKKVWILTMKCKGEWFERFKEFWCMSGGGFD